MMPGYWNNRLFRLKVVLLQQIIVCLVVYRMILSNIAFGHNLLCAVISTLHALALLAHASSKVRDVKEAYRDTLLLEHGKSLKKMNFKQMNPKRNKPPSQIQGVKYTDLQ